MPARLPRDFAPVTIRAGVVTLRFEPASLWLRDLSSRGVEFVRAVYPAVRDTDWSTAEPVVSWVRCDVGRDRFSLALRARYGGVRPSFEWTLVIGGSPDNSVRLEAEGAVFRPFSTNRTGLCVLHPAELAGRACLLEHTDGRRERARFPREIRPHQPFLDLHAIAHRVPGVGQVEVHLEGDTFETEDQRNWTDASFKTYSRPLALPFPYTLAAGTRVRQAVTVRLSPIKRRRSRSTDAPLRLDNRHHALPAVGLRLTAATAQGTTQAWRLRHLPLGHLRLDLDTCAPGSLRGWEDALRALAAFPPETQLEVALHCQPGDLGLELLAHAAAGQARGRTLRWIVLDRESGCTTASAWNEVRCIWSRHQVPGALGGGARADFVHINRERPVFNGLEFVSFALDPQVHAFDEASMLETLTIHPAIVAQTRRLAGGLPVVLSPVTLGTPRHPGPAPRGDRRQFTPFAAVWTLGCLAAATHAEASAVTLHGTAGPAGVLPPGAGRPSPLLRLLEAWLEFPARFATTLVPGTRRNVSAVALHGKTGVRLLLANLRPNVQSALLAGMPRPRPRTKVLSALGGSRPAARRRGPLLIVDLPGHAVLQLDFPAS